MSMGDIPSDPLGWKALLRRISRATRDPQNAEDHLHAAFIRLREYSVTRQVANPTGFLIRAARNLAIDSRRQDNVRTESASQVADLLRCETTAPLQDEVLDARKRLEAVRSALEELSERTRDIFLMHRLEGRKYREIAGDLGITVSAVEKHIAKASLHLLTRFETP